MDKKNPYKDTLNLPKTTFPMRANLAQNEPITIKRWHNEQSYDSQKENQKEDPAFILHDGPPYANGDIHLGHLLNKVLKDIVIRSQARIGHYCEFRPGWDCHGLPIEHKVLSEISKEKTEKLATLDPHIRSIAIRNECQRYAEKYVQIQAKQMQRLLTTADYKNPYLTMSSDFEKGGKRIFHAAGRFIKPAKGWISSRFGRRRHPIFKRYILHSGTDIAAPKGYAIRASNTGYILFAGWKKGYGNVTIINHGVKKGKRHSTVYAHQSRIIVRKNQYVRKGQLIGYVGSTGYSTGPHLHFEYRINGKPINPERYVKL